jgi:general secretion pathway protein A
MYEDFYRFDKAPFHVTPDPDFFYWGSSHKEALAALTYGITQRKGFIVIVGDVGLGKTSIVRFYLARLDRTKLATAYVFNANVTFTALLDTIYQELGIPDKPKDVYGMVNRLQEVFIEEYRHGRNVVLIVDEAQNMPVETLESLRVLSNLETSTEKLLQIVLVGQPEFADKLDLRQLRQLKQRIAVRCMLVPFTAAASLEYIEHRVKTAGASSLSVFTRGALRRIVRHAEGIPRRINILCDNALVTGFGYQKAPVTTAIVKEVIADLEGKVPISHHRRASASVAAALLLAGTAFMASTYGEIFLSDRGTGMEAPPSPPAPTRPAIEPSRHASSALKVEGDRGLAEAVAPVLPAGGQSTTHDPVIATRVVEQRDSLSRLALQVYGFSSEQILERVVKANPRIADMNRILVGTVIRFPDVSDLRAAKRRPSSRRR